MSTTNSKLTRVADNIRILSAAMVEKAKSGHPGGAMGGADFITVLFTEFLRYDPDNMAYPYRDRFFLDPGHMSPMLYSTLALAGHYSTDYFSILIRASTATTAFSVAKSGFISISLISVAKRSKVDKRTIISANLSSLTPFCPRVP